MNTLLEKVKANLILGHSVDDELLLMYISAAVSYAESYQHIEAGYYSTHDMPPTTEQAVIMLSSHFYESRDGSTGGFFADRPEAARQIWNTVNLLLRLDRVYDLLGLTIAGGCCMVDPELVVLGGGMSKAGQVLLDGVEPRFQHHMFHACKGTKFALAQLGNDAGIYGSFHLALSAR